MKFGILFAFVSVASFASETTIMVKLRPRLTYREALMTCSTVEDPAEIEFSGKVKNNSVTQAAMRELTHQVIAAKIGLVPAEMATIEVEKDTREWLRLKTFPLSERLLRWFFFNSGSQGQCKPSQRLLTVEPSSFLFQFSPEGTNTGTFKGSLYDGTPYKAELTLSQSVTDRGK